MQLPVLDDSFEGDDVNLLAVSAGRVDRNFRRNYAWAKHAADVGKLKKIVVVVDVDGSDPIHTVGAVQSAVSGVRLHGKAVFLVRGGTSAGQIANASQVSAELEATLAAEPEPEPVKPVAKPAVKPAVKEVEKTGDKPADTV